MAAAFALLLVLAALLSLKSKSRNLKHRAITILARVFFTLGAIGLLAAGAWEAIEAASNTYSPIAAGLFVAAIGLSLFIIWSLRRDRGPGPGGGPPEF